MKRLLFAMLLLASGCDEKNDPWYCGRETLGVQQTFNDGTLLECRKISANPDGSLVRFTWVKLYPTAVPVR